MKIQYGVVVDWFACGPNKNRAQSVLVPRLINTPCGQLRIVEKDGRELKTLENTTSRLVEQTRSPSMTRGDCGTPLAERQSQTIG